MTVLLNRHVRRVQIGGAVHLFAGLDDHYYAVRFEPQAGGACRGLGEAVTASLFEMLGIAHAKLRPVVLGPTVARAIHTTGAERALPEKNVYLGLQLPGRPDMQSIHEHMPVGLLGHVENIQDFWGALCIDTLMGSQYPRRALFVKAKELSGSQSLMTEELGAHYKAHMASNWYFKSGDSRQVSLGRENLLYRHNLVYRRVSGMRSFERWISAIHRSSFSLDELTSCLPTEWLSESTHEILKYLEHLERSKKRIEELLAKVRDSNPDAFPAWLRSC